jgi:hypothetical protein
VKFIEITPCHFIVSSDKVEYFRFNANTWEELSFHIGSYWHQVSDKDKLAELEAAFQKATG